MTVDTTVPRSRRAVLAAAVGGVAGLVAGSLGRPVPADAAAGGPLIMGAANTAGTTNTSLTTSSTGTALLVTQNGSGTALRGSAVGPNSIAGFFTAQNGTGVSGVTGNPNSYGVFGQNNGAAGTAGAMRAAGGTNNGLVANTTNGGKYGVLASNSGVSSGGAAIRGDGGQNIGVSGFTSGSSWYGVAASTLDSSGTAMRADGGAVSGVGLTAYGANAVAGYSSAQSFGAIYGEHTATTGTNYGVYGQVDSTDLGATGVYGTDSGGGGVTNGVNGFSSSGAGNGVFGQATAVSSSAFGVFGSSPDGYGLYSSGDCHVIGDITASGSKVGYVVDVALNGSPKALRQGDAVTLLGVRPAVLGSIPLLVVGPAGKGDAAIGVVDRRVEITPANKAGAEGNHLKGKGTVVQPDEHLYVVTLGAFAVASADVSAGPIKAGSRLAVGANGKVVKATPLQLNGRSFYPAGEQVGYALGELATGSSTIGIFVSPH